MGRWQDGVRERPASRHLPRQRDLPLLLVSGRRRLHLPEFLEDGVPSVSGRRYTGVSRDERGDALNSDAEDRLAILELVQNWAIWRDAGDWERFRTVWHDDGWMTATWFQGPAEAFIEITKTGFESGVSILHLLGGSCVEVKGDTAICQTRMTISQRAPVDGVLADVSVSYTHLTLPTNREV